MEIYLHTKGSQPILIAVEPDTTLAELVNRSGVADGRAWLEDADDEFEASASVASAGLNNRAHVHVGVCRRIAVSVEQGGNTLAHDFPPGATIAAAFAWAVGPHGFNLSAAERAKHTLILCGTNDEPDRSTHVGSLAGDDCSVCLSLVPKERFEG